MTTAAAEAAQARAARIAGAMYLITTATAVFSEFVVRSSLIVSDATQTAHNIIASERLFRIGIASDLASAAGVVVLTWALYVLLRPVDRNLALLATFWRLAEAAMLCVVALNSVVVLVLLSGADYLKTFEVNQLHSLARLALGAQGTGSNVVFILLGLGSSVFAYLLLKSRYVPKVLAGWGVFSSLLMTTYALLSIVFPNATRPLQLACYAPMAIYEITLGPWLLLKGARIQASSARAA
jgi:hypothetical protein